MKLKIKYFSTIVIAALLLVSACNSDEPKISKNIIPIYKNSTPVLTIGSDNEDATTALYKAIYYFHLKKPRTVRKKVKVGLKGTKDNVS
jgi:hypothetical protein